MQYISKLLPSLFIGSCLFLTINELNAQSDFSATGTDAFGSDLSSVSYTVGQVAFSNFTNPQGWHTTEGVQQPYDEIIIGTNEVVGIKLTCRIYPNPAIDVLVLSVDNTQQGETLLYTLYDLQGRILATNAVVLPETLISIGHLPAAPYFISIKSTNTAQTFTLLKIN